LQSPFGINKQYYSLKKGGKQKQEQIKGGKKTHTHQPEIMKKEER
jgi:hypothetical protein